VAISLQIFIRASVAFFSSKFIRASVAFFLFKVHPCICGILPLQISIRALVAFFFNYSSVAFLSKNSSVHLWRSSSSKFIRVSVAFFLFKSPFAH